MGIKNFDEKQIYKLQILGENQAQEPEWYDVQLGLPVGANLVRYLNKDNFNVTGHTLTISFQEDGNVLTPYVWQVIPKNGAQYKVQITRGPGALGQGISHYISRDWVSEIETYTVYNEDRCQITGVKVLEGYVDNTPSSDKDFIIDRVGKVITLKIDKESA